MSSKPTTLSSLQQVAKRLHISLNTLRQLIKEGKIKAVRLSARCVRISDAEVERYIAAQQISFTNSEVSL